MTTSSARRPAFDLRTGTTSKNFAVQRFFADVNINATVPLTSLHGLRLGRIERRILLDLVAGVMPQPETDTRAAQEAFNRAVRKLSTATLVARRPFHDDVVLMPLGRRLVRAYQTEIEAGKPIRWAKLAARAPWDTSEVAAAQTILDQQTNAAMMAFQGKI